ncbi:MAG: hypothetical protein Q7J46_15970 [Pseudomonas sp.]|jgi:hypothetical protein|nr:hypothetical protein [Pseudomonas sp.]
MTTERFSDAAHGKVVHLQQRDPQEALKRLNRITGLHFSHWPASLVPHCAEPAAEPLAEQGSCAVRVFG